ncbi:MAG: hypothetical protein WCL44_02715 [bacterium]
MKEILARIMVALAALVFSASFFLPADSDRSPAKVLKGIAETVSSLDDVVAAAIFTAVAVVIAYPYAWALLLAFSAAAGRKRRFLENRWLHLGFHAVGGLLVAAVGITMLIIRDTWIPTPVQWAAATAPFVVLAMMILLILAVDRTRGVWVIAVLGLLPHVPVQLMLVRVATGMDESPLGFVMGGAGAAVATAGSLLLLYLRSPARKSG